MPDATIAPHAPIAVNATAPNALKDRPSMSHALDPSDRFEPRHLGPDERETAEMLALVGYASLDALTDAIVPKGIRLSRALNLPAARA
ncbi:MAG: hypothetical protein KDA16_03295, partial [Phycisphaerales bacterium]|nr:hypothetical protein [Phycisphaerales bacterium]